MFKVNNKDTRTTPIVNFEQPNADWEYSGKPTKEKKQKSCIYLIYIKVSISKYLEYLLEVYQRNKVFLLTHFWPVFLFYTH